MYINTIFLWKFFIIQIVHYNSKILNFLHFKGCVSVAYRNDMYTTFTVSLLPLLIDLLWIISC